MSKQIEILIVDDEINFLDSISKRLELRGFQVTKSCDGLEASEIAKSNRYDLALIDLKMPGLDGIELLRFLKTRHEFIEVIIFTGHGSLEAAQECMRHGAFGYLPKPLEFDKLLEKLKDAFLERIRRKFQNNSELMQQITQIASGEKSLQILKELNELDDKRK